MGEVNRATNRQGGMQGADDERRHRVHTGETLSHLAARYDVSLAQLLAANRQIRDPNRIFAGQTLVIPAARRNERNAVTHGQTTAREQRYTVRPGDSMWEIASRRGIEVESLIRANLSVKNPALIYPGQRLRLPARETNETPNANTRRDTPATRRTETDERTTARQTPRTDRSQNVERTQQPQAEGGNGFRRVNLEQFLSGGTNSQAAIIVGISEGNRTPSGGFRGSYNGHADPGNGAHNIGSFSYQGGGAQTPGDADRIWLRELRRVTPRYIEAAERAGLDPQNSLLASSYYDLHTQSPRSAGRFLRQLSALRRDGVTPQNIIEARMRSYIDPATGRLSATGFDNDPVLLRADQTRRTRELVRALRGQNLTVETSGTDRTTPNRNQTGTRYTVAPPLSEVQAGRAVLQRGQQGAAVSRVQELLGIETDGKFGSRTQSAVAEFQRAQGLRPPEGMQGMVGKTTLAALERSRRTNNGGGTERAGLPDTTGMTDSQKYDVYARYVETHGSAEARRDLAAGRRVILGLRVPTNTGANNGNGSYDDRMVVMSRGRNGVRQVSEFRANTEPSAYYEDTPANRRAGHNVTTINAGGDRRGDLGRIPSGTYEFRKEFRAGFGRAQDRAGRNILKPTRNIIAERDTNHDGWINGNDPVTNRANLNSGRTMYFHRGGSSRTGSAGCQTMTQANFDAFWQSLGSQEEFQYVLVNVGRRR